MRLREASTTQVTWRRALSGHFALEPKQLSGKLVGSRQCDQMAPGDHMRLLFETLSSNALLKFERKEPVIRRGDHLDRYVGPALETARFLDDRLRLITLMRGARPQHGLRHVVQK